MNACEMGFHGKIQRKAIYDKIRNEICTRKAIEYQPSAKKYPRKTLRVVGYHINRMLLKEYMKGDHEVTKNAAEEENQ